ncbi:MAG: hypothetical protein ABI977_22040 [Acidobacteriota bacterium]
MTTDTNRNLPALPDEQSSSQGITSDSLTTQTHDRMLTLLEREFQVRSEEIKLRHRELELRGEESERGHEYATRALEVQTVDLRDDRKTDLVKTKYTYFLVVTLSVLAIALVSYALNLGKETFVLDIVKVLVGAAGGAGLGYWKGYRKGQDETVPDEEEQ